MMPQMMMLFACMIMRGTMSIFPQAVKRIAGPYVLRQ
jgi:hypothetical protein